MAAHRLAFRSVVMAVAALGFSAHARAAKIACVGDSITAGYGLGDPGSESYPAVLAAKLGTAHSVQNYGVSGTTLLKNGDAPYWSTSSYTASGTFAPDVVIVMLGTNDSKPQNWSKKAEFPADYAELIAHYRALGALVYVATPPPVVAPGAYGIPSDVVANEVVPLVRTIASDAGAPLVDVFTALSGKPEDFPDTVHPNAAGAALIAAAVQQALDQYGFGGAAGMGGGAGSGQGGRAGAANGGGGAGGSGAGGAPAGGKSASGGTGASAAMGAGGAVTGGAGGGGMSRGGAAGATSGGAGLGGTVGSGGTGGRGMAGGGAGGSTPGGTGGAGASSGLGGAPGSGVGGSGGAPAGATNGGAPTGSAPAGKTANDGSGCGCRADAGRRAGSVPWLLLAVAGAAWRKRRRP